MNPTPDEVQRRAEEHANSLYGYLEGSPLPRSTGWSESVSDYLAGFAACARDTAAVIEAADKLADALGSHTHRDERLFKALAEFRKARVGA